jgi:uncharacterized membrane protein YeiH
MPDPLLILHPIDLIGTAVFAISGALTAMEKKLDIFGVAVVAFITALGGGTLRDVLLGNTPVGWMNDLHYLAMIGLGLAVSLIFKRHVQKLRRTFFLFDTIGIATFTVLGLQKALAIGMHPLIAMMMGVVSAVFGGVTRDIICNEIPLIFRKEIYALTCLAGGGLFMLLRHFGIDPSLNILITVAFIATFRVLVVKFKWSLPVFGGNPVR